MRKSRQACVPRGKGGWEVGEGRLKGVNPSDVKGISTDEVMKMVKGKMKSAGADHKMHGKM